MRCSALGDASGSLIHIVAETPEEGYHLGVLARQLRSGDLTGSKLETYSDGAICLKIYAAASHPTEPTP